VLTSRHADVVAERFGLGRATCAGWLANRPATGRGVTNENVALVRSARQASSPVSWYDATLPLEAVPLNDPSTIVSGLGIP